MPLILTKSKAVYLHTPKTGGTWVREALTNAGVVWKDFGHQHTNFGKSRKLSSSGIRFTTIRNPVSWYPSYWSMKVTEGWQHSILHPRCESNDFNTFIHRVCRYYSLGFLNYLYSTYANSSTKILRTENLGEDLTNILTELKEPQDREALLNTPKTNCKLLNPEYSKKSLRLLEKTERIIFHKYKYSIKG